MRSYFAEKFTQGLIAGLGISLVFGAVVWVRAIAPGATANPTFGPTNDDVAPQFIFDCTRINNGTCPAGFSLTGGGGNANDDNNTIMPTPNAAGATPTRFAVDGGSDFNICCRVIAN